MKNRMKLSHPKPLADCATTVEQGLLCRIKPFFFFFEPRNPAGASDYDRHISNLILPVVLLGVPEHPVAEPADVPEGRVALVPQLLQPQHWPVPAVRERGLQQLEDLVKNTHSPMRHCLLLRISVKACVLPEVHQKYAAATKVLGHGARTEDADHLYSTPSAGIFSSTTHCPEPAESWKLKGPFGPNNLRPKLCRSTEWLGWVGRDHKGDLDPILCHGQGHLPPGQAVQAPSSLATFSVIRLFLFSKNSSHRQSLEKTTAHLL